MEVLIVFDFLNHFSFVYLKPLLPLSESSMQVLVLLIDVLPSTVDISLLLHQTRLYEVARSHTFASLDKMNSTVLA